MKVLNIYFILLTLLTWMIFIGFIYNSSLYAYGQINSGVSQGLQVGNKAPDFKLTDPVKGIITKENFTGKPLFIFFTATYCTPCQIGAENLARYDNETGGNAFNVLVVFVDPSETDNQFIEWKQKHGRDDWYIAKGIGMAQEYDVRVTDTKYLFDKDGIIKWINLKPLEYSTIHVVLGSLLQR